MPIPNTFKPKNLKEYYKRQPDYVQNPLKNNGILLKKFPDLPADRIENNFEEQNQEDIYQDIMQLNNDRLENFRNLLSLEPEENMLRYDKDQLDFPVEEQIRKDYEKIYKTNNLRDPLLKDIYERYKY